MSNLYHPSTEIVHFPETVYPDEVVKLTFQEKTSNALRQTNSRLRNPMRRWRTNKITEIRDHVLVDRRELTSYNVSLFILFSVMPFQLVKRCLKEEGISVEPILIVEDKIPQYCLDMLQLLGIKYLRTDSTVAGRVAQLEYGREICVRDLGPTIKPQWTPTCPGPDRVFISRRKTRRITNEAEVLRYLQSNGFTRVFFEDLSVEQQWNAVANAKIVVGIHGAGLANLIAREMSPLHKGKLAFIELFGPGYVVDPYRKLASVYGWKYAAVRGAITSQVVRDLDEQYIPRKHSLSDFRVCLDSLSQALLHVTNDATV